MGESKHVSIVLDTLVMLTQSGAVTAVDGASFKHKLDLLANEVVNVWYPRHQPRSSTIYVLFYVILCAINK